MSVTPAKTLLCAAVKNSDLSLSACYDSIKKKNGLDKPQ
ncbi:hypothetical protein VCRA2111O408_50027 [Vibrio crassostreae]|nr:hypothetical protein VCRA2111O408_50027 [Vibrio crassostreae]